MALDRVSLREGQLIGLGGCFDFDGLGAFPQMHCFSGQLSVQWHFFVGVRVTLVASRFGSGFLGWELGWGGRPESCHWWLDRSLCLDNSLPSLASPARPALA